jgi:hypothetical protein
MRYGPDYDRGHAGYPQGRHDLGRGPETNWMGRHYRSPGEPHGGYDAPYRGGPRARYGAWDVAPEDRGYGRDYAGYDRPYRPLGGMPHGYDRAYRGRGGYDRTYRAGGYDRGYRESGRGRGMEMGGGVGDPYGPYRMLQGRSGQWGSPWPGRYFTDHGHNSGPY